MIQIRKNVYETNSSSTHSICISKEPYPDIKNLTIHFHAGEYGWENGCVTDTASYLYTAIVDSSSKEEYESRISKLKEILDKHSIKYTFSSVCCSRGYYEFIYEDGYIDHSCELVPFINNVLEDEDLLLRYLLGNSCIYTGNDNSNDSEDDCYRADPFIWDDKLGSIPNPKHDIEHYDYYFKGN